MLCIRLDIATIDGIRATLPNGKGYQTKINAILGT